MDLNTIKIGEIHEGGTWISHQILKCVNTPMYYSTILRKYLVKNHSILFKKNEAQVNIFIVHLPAECYFGQRQ